MTISSELWRNIFDAIEEPVFLHDAQFRVLLANRAYCHAAGVPEQEVLGKPYWEVFPPGTGPTPGCQEALDGKHLEGSHEEVRVGAKLYFSSSYTVRDEQGRLLHALHKMRDITERRRALEAVRLSATRYQLLFESSRDALMTMVPPSWKFTEANQATVRLFGAGSAAQFSALGPRDVSPRRQPDGRLSSEKAQEMIETALREGSRFFEWEHQRLDGRPFAADVLLTRMEVGADVFLQATVRDISERKQAEDALRLSALRHRLLFESSRYAQMTLAPPSWKFTEANQATVQLFGAASVAQFTALGPWDISPQRQPDGRLSSEKAQEMIETAMREGSRFFEWEHQRLDGQPFAADVLLTRMEVGEDVFLQATVRDISERKRLENELRRQARTDMLTGLNNRRYFFELAEQQLARAKRYGEPLTALMLDLDRFKLVNDHHGHQVGDMVLQKLSEVCLATLRGIDILGRIGGEEFAILMPQTDSGQALEVAERLRLAIAAASVPLALADPVRFTVSIGAASFQTMDATFEDLLNRADLALYTAKNTGRNRVCCDSPVK